MAKSLKQSLVWHRIGAESADRPDVDIEVMVYDRQLDDVVLAALTVDNGDVELWIESTCGDPLPDPSWWAKKPYPEG